METRYKEHQAGKSKTTKPYRPFIVIYKEAFETGPEARTQEKILKTGAGKEFLKHLVI